MSKLLKQYKLLNFLVIQEDLYTSGVADISVVDATDLAQKLNIPPDRKFTKTGIRARHEICNESQVT